MNRQLTQEEAVKLFDSEEWKTWTPYQRAITQMTQDRLFMPFGEFHRAVEEVLGRGIDSLEMAAMRQSLIAELAEKAPKDALPTTISLINE